jgi:hypothetical protein
MRLRWVEDAKCWDNYLAGASLHPPGRCELMSYFCQARIRLNYLILTNKQAPWLQSASELYRLSDRRLSAKLVPTLADRGCRVVSATDLHGRILGFLDRSRYNFFQVALQLYSRDWVDPIPDPLLLRKSGSESNYAVSLNQSPKDSWE